MLYKTIILELIQQNPDLHDQPRSKKMLLPLLDHYSMELKKSHEQWKAHLIRNNPGSDPSQIASEALELALEELELTSRLTHSAERASIDPLSLDAAMAFLHRPTPSPKALARRPAAARFRPQLFLRFFCRSCPARGLR